MRKKVQILHEARVNLPALTQVEVEAWEAERLLMLGLAEIREDEKPAPDEKPEPKKAPAKKSK